MRKTILILFAIIILALAVSCSGKMNSPTADLSTPEITSELGTTYSSTAEAASTPDATGVSEPTGTEKTESSISVTENNIAETSTNKNSTSGNKTSDVTTPPTESPTATSRVPVNNNTPIQSTETTPTQPPTQSPTQPPTQAPTQSPATEPTKPVYTEKDYQDIINAVNDYIAQQTKLKFIPRIDWLNDGTHQYHGTPSLNLNGKDKVISILKYHVDLTVTNLTGGNGGVPSTTVEYNIVWYK
ncbi:MAG: hypothetical protein LBI03_09400, partial [Clostridiales bacterium]|nr:hypothetical protein [Clostridiales bacterium]